MNANTLTLLRHLLTIGIVLLCAPVFGQDKILSGMVMDVSTNDPIPSVSIQFTGAAAGGALSNQQGKYSIRYNARFRMLQFSAIGYKTKTIHIDSLRSANGLVTLER